MNGMTRAAYEKRSARRLASARTDRRPGSRCGRPIPNHSELGEFIQTEMRSCARFVIEEHPSGLRVLDTCTDRLMDTDQIRAYRSQLELERGDWAPTRTRDARPHDTHATARRGGA